MVLAANSATAQYEHSSLGMVLGTPQKITVAVDSRRNLGNDQFVDTVCKIAALDGKFVFFAVNRTFGPGWDSQTEARSTWKSRPTTGDLTWLANQWGEQVKARFLEDFAKDPPDTVTLAQDSVLVIGVFAMISKGKIVIARTQITLAPHLFFASPSFHLEVDTNPMSSEGFHLRAFGHASIAIEYGQAFLEYPKIVSERSHSYVPIMRAKVKSVPAAKRDAALLEELGNLTTKLHSRGIAVHGPYDILEMTPKGGIHWIQRKSNCPAD